MTTSTHVSKVNERTIQRLLSALIDQHAASIIIKPYAAQDGFWFGGGNLVEDKNGTLWLCGRYRNAGDSRTGLAAGVRGLELAIFRSNDKGKTFEKVSSFTKNDLSSAGIEVVSIEGSALHQLENGSWELFVSTEKKQSYPVGYEQYQKPETGVWSIDRLTAPTPDAFTASKIEPVLVNKDEPAYLHVKDPVVFNDGSGDTILMFCSHPLSWSSANTGYAVRKAGSETFEIVSWQLVERGAVWDVAVTRLTDRLILPQFGILGEMASVAVYFYDGAESMRQLDQNPLGVQRPRGFSCEEIGGAMLGTANMFPNMQRLSHLEPLFVSPHGTGSSRYISTLITNDYLYAIWQQSQSDKSQPLVMNRLTLEEMQHLLTE